MSVLWYYRPEHAETERLPKHISCEIFASKHHDENSIACIEDKCYVLTFSEYCRSVLSRIDLNPSNAEATFVQSTSTQRFLKNL